ncbi:cytochrome c [Ramlibacter sp. USB13]|uniref:Cytochrome c n=1 Tax=Ramlibacter cellulosilyticus TaxID=2764187 RepID=A0A923MQX1_9BURK|nr:cytochrome c [Ramlibacter cellulosilyticus]MBC5783256.1 cytochrome c [Ramlibacter cellulosilyticus]
MRLLFVALAAFAATSAHAQDTSATRGRLLYGNHCVECHTQQMHWRDQRLARDWDTLLGQVRRFQGIAGLNWAEDDVQAVARYLNETIYRFPQAQAQR